MWMLRASNSDDGIDAVCCSRGDAYLEKAKLEAEWLSMILTAVA